MQTNRHIGTGLALKSISIVTIIIAALSLAGCFSDDTTVSTNAPATYTISGTIVSPVSGAPISGVTCSLTDDPGVTINAAPAAATTVSKTATTDANGAYSFTKVPAGRFRLRTTSGNLIPTATIFNVAGDVTHEIRQPARSEWTQIAGEGNPYDSSEIYVTVHSDVYPPRSIGSEDANVVVELKHATNPTLKPYKSKGHHNGSTVDWAASKTFSSGMTIFKGVTAGQSYSVSAQKDGVSFETATLPATSPGEVTHVVLKGTPAVNGFPVTIINNTGVYKTDEVFLAITGQDSSGSNYFYDPSSSTMKIITESPKGDKFCFSLASLKSTAPQTFVYTHPFDNTFVCRVYVFFKNKNNNGRLNFGVNNNDAKHGLREPSAANEDKYTIFDKFELTCNGKEVVLNTTTVDFISIGLKFKFLSDNIEKGFEVLSNEELFTPFTSRTDNWKNAVVKDSSGNVIRVLSPTQHENANDEFATLDKAIDNGWKHYSTNELSIKHGAWYFKGRVTLDPKGNTANDTFEITEVTSSGAFLNTAEVIVGRPTSYTIFTCDGPLLKNIIGNPRLAALHNSICTAFNRGVFCNKDWSVTTDFYKDTATNAGQYNLFSAILHKKGIGGVAYGFPYDDNGDKSTTVTKSYGEAKNGVVVTLPKMPALK